MKERGFGNVIDNLYIMSLQAPFDLRLNYMLMYMIIVKFLIHLDKKDLNRGSTTGQRLRSGCNSNKFINYLSVHVREPIHPLIFINDVDIHDCLIYSTQLHSYEIHKTKDMLISYLKEFDSKINKKVL